MAGEQEKPAAKVAPLRKAVPCPICKRASAREHYPFCSERCRDVDLNRWLSGSYAIPVADDETRAEDDEM
jgi:endogenous inhibitor of DNA gyrase (YacG/DUF329 family)